MEVSNPAIIKQEHWIHQFFEISVFLKGIHAVIEIVGGILLLLLARSSTFIPNLIAFFTQDELAEDPNDYISNWISQMVSHISVTSEHFAAWYLLSHGIVKIILVTALLKNKLWAYPWSLAVLGAFILYQLYRFTFTHSIGLILLTVFDLAVMWLIWKEYSIVKAHRAIQ